MNIGSSVNRIPWGYSSVVIRLEPVEYDQTHELADLVTPDTPQSRANPDAYRASKGAQHGKLEQDVVGIPFGEDGHASVTDLNYGAIFTYGVKVIQELHETVNLQQLQIEQLKRSFVLVWFGFG